MKPPLGSGERFAALSASLAKKGVRDPNALAASIGRKKYGAKKMAQMSAAGSHRNAATSAIESAMRSRRPGA